MSVFPCLLTRQRPRQTKHCGDRLTQMLTHSMPRNAARSKVSAGRANAVGGPDKTAALLSLTTSLVWRIGTPLGQPGFPAAWSVCSGTPNPCPATVVEGLSRPAAASCVSPDRCRARPRSVASATGLSEVSIMPNPNRLVSCARRGVPTDMGIFALSLMTRHASHVRYRHAWQEALPC